MRALLLVTVAGVGCGRIAFDELVPMEPTASCEQPVATVQRIVTDGSVAALDLTSASDRLALAYWMPSRGQIAVQPIDLAGIPMGTATPFAASLDNSGEGGPSITWTGTELGLVRTVKGALTDAPVVLSRLDRTGAPIAADTTVTMFAHYVGGTTIGWNSSEYGVVFASTFSTVERYGAWFTGLSSDGTRIRPGLQVAHAGDCICIPVVAWTGTDWVIVFDDDGFTGAHTIGLTRVDAAGNLIAAPVAIDDEDGVNHVRPIIASNGTTLVATWIRANLLLGVSEVAVKHLDATGVGLAQQEVYTTMTTSDIANAGDGFALAYAGEGSVGVTTYDDAFASSTNWSMATTGPASSVAVTALDGIVYVAWTEAGNASLARLACPAP